MPKLVAYLHREPIEDGAPQAFYSPDPQSELEALSDSTLDPSDIEAHEPSEQGSDEEGEDEDEY